MDIHTYVRTSPGYHSTAKHNTRLTGEDVVMDTKHNPSVHGQCTLDIVQAEKSTFYFHCLHPQQTGHYVCLLHNLSSACKHQTT